MIEARAVEARAVEARAVEARAVEALAVEVRAPVASFRNPLYAGVQVGLPCPPPATVGGMLAAVAGGWDRVPDELRFAMVFSAAGEGIDLETYHPLDASGAKALPTPKDRPFLAEVSLWIWLVDDLRRWERALRRPVWPLRLGRSQDLATARARRVRLAPGAGRQGYALVPAQLTSAGTLLQLPTAVSHDRSRARWHPYRYHRGGSQAELPEGWVSEDGQAV
ncbi:MAG: CRISPR-associated protein Cas5, partial [Pseudonocardiaceae bacterium]